MRALYNWCDCRGEITRSLHNRSVLSLRPTHPSYLTRLRRDWAPYREQKAYIPRQQFPRSIFADTSDTSDILARMQRVCRACRACRATSPFSWPRAYLIGRPAVCCDVVLPVCPCVVSFSNVHEHDGATCCGQVASILAASSSDTPDFLVTC